MSSNVLEHVPDPEAMAAEMLRVVRPGGIVWLSWTTWLSPWGGHETSPWHYLGGRRAADRYADRHGHRPKNDYGRTLFPVSVARMTRWAARQPRAQVLRVLPRYHPRWARWVAAVPGVREVACWNVVIVLRRRRPLRPRSPRKPPTNGQTAGRASRVGPVAGPAGRRPGAAAARERIVRWVAAAVSLALVVLAFVRRRAGSQPTPSWTSASTRWGSRPGPAPVGLPRRPGELQNQAYGYLPADGPDLRRRPR
jgi:hypothetical protein